nr:MAG TPA: hypothetical protein [Caudoviricetes sp.]
MGKYQVFLQLFQHSIRAPFSLPLIAHQLSRFYSPPLYNYMIIIHSLLQISKLKKAKNSRLCNVRKKAGCIFGIIPY